jgi:MFS transporter, ACS family, solute carrier family 17 (sodium-dependent inorganic phosphate cotransporter), member 5
MFSSKSVLTIIITNILSDFTLYAILTSFPHYLAEVFNIGIVWNSYISSFEYALMLLFTIIGGITADKLIKSNKMSQLNTRRLFNSIGMMLPALLFSLIGFISCQYYSLGIIILVIAGGLPGFYLSAGYLINIIDIAGAYSGVIIGISNSLGIIQVSFLFITSVNFTFKSKRQYREYLHHQ